jgi:hypothetical protein
VILNYRQDNPRRPTDADKRREREAKERWTRLDECGKAIADLPDNWTPADVLAVLRWFDVDAFDFAEMDERPRQFSRWDWHPRLRVTRNDPTINLFGHLE